ncbi:lipopolysaccharide assembly protein LapB [uncultured Shewanella sp.]|uniref:tetratricopeptide repeat protein n=1 Tax=uncultured Shewanella sp. TaxID=173975 RepID=UPI00260CC859|nr:tetratricopeptide repeat protein [uncultured Shewanella sp.]
MRSLLLFLSIALLMLSFSVKSEDEFINEVKLRETPHLALQDILARLPNKYTFDEQVEFSQLVRASRLSSAEFKHQLMQLARIYLLTDIDIDISVNERYQLAKNIITALEKTIETPLEKGMLLMLKGRYLKQTAQDYIAAIDLYKQALDHIGLQSSQQALLLKYILYEGLGIMYRMVKQSALSLSYLNQCKAIAFSIKNKYLIVKSEIYLGRYHQTKEELKESLEHFTQAIKLSEHIKMPALRAELYMQVAHVYKSLRQWDDALKYTQEASFIYTKIKKEHKIIAAIRFMAMIYAEKGQWNYAIDYHLTALQSDIHLGNYIGQAIDYHNLGEAYFRIKDYEAAYSYLKKADVIFSKKKASHYLVYNDLLLADISLVLKQFTMAKTYAISAFDNAEQLNLLNEKKQALQLQITIYKQLKQFAKALFALENWLQLGSEVEKNAKNQRHANAMLAQEKLQSILLNANHQHNSDMSLQTRYQLILMALLGLITFIFIAYIGLWRNRHHLRCMLTEQSTFIDTDPIANLPGYSAFISTLSKSNLNQACSIILCSLTDQLNADLSLGFQANRDLHQTQHHAISHTFNAQVFYIRSGIFALYIPQHTNTTDFMQEFRTFLNQHHWQTHFHIGLLNLPLHADPAIKIDLETHFAAAQMMLSGAMSLGEQEDFYVTMTTLDFAPASIFTPPIYQQLTRNIDRGLVKIETNGNKNHIIWHE